MVDDASVWCLGVFPDGGWVTWMFSSMWPEPCFLRVRGPSTSYRCTTEELKILSDHVRVRDRETEMEAARLDTFPALAQYLRQSKSSGSGTDSSKSKPRTSVVFRSTSEGPHCPSGYLVESPRCPSGYLVGSWTASFCYTMRAGQGAAEKSNQDRVGIQVAGRRMEGMMRVVSFSNPLDSDDTDKFGIAFLLMDRAQLVRAHFKCSGSADVTVAGHRAVQELVNKLLRERSRSTM